MMNQPRRIRGGGQRGCRGLGGASPASPDSPPRLGAAPPSLHSPPEPPAPSGARWPAINNPAWVRAQVTLWKYLPQSLLRPASSLGTRGRGGERLRSRVDLEAGDRKSVV